MEYKKLLYYPFVSWVFYLPSELCVFCKKNKRGESFTLYESYDLGDYQSTCLLKGNIVLKSNQENEVTWADFSGSTLFSFISFSTV